MIDAPAKSRERAYEVWRNCGQNITETARVLKRDHNYEISRQSLHAWKEKYDWEARAARAEAEEKSRTEETSDDSLLTVLLNQKKKYEDYFDTLALGTVDNQAIYAYNSILKTLLDIRERTLVSLNAGGGGPEVELRVIKTPGDAVSALQEAVEKKLNVILADPGAASLKAVKEMESALELIEKMRARYQKDSGEKEKSKGLSDAAANKIRRKIMGIVQK